jgi:uncharacterized protein YyaL (SSP411 family)
MSDHRHTNRLVHETSPYLLQHAHNPVDWRPWSDAALAEARAADRPIFLSVGYSTCHWCHVMERESFEHQDVADLLNAYFIPIKVDREERPDIDEQYMLATQLFTGRGGWPNSVFLTPDGRPWYAGTYFPKEDRPGMAGFKTLLTTLHQTWLSRRDEVEQQAQAFVDAIRNAAATHPGHTPLSGELFASALAHFHRTYDRRHGGFGSSPKFPPHGALTLLLQHVRLTGDDTSAAMIHHTLTAMADGGIHDHIGGGFHRYATDSRWFLPHFEKMLYDNAQIMRNLAEAYALDPQPRYAAVASGIFDWLSREMTHPLGGFYSAIDADSEGEEGRFYVWSEDEVRQVLAPDDADLFIHHHGLTDIGNFLDEATRQRTGSNVVYLPQPLPDDPDLLQHLALLRSALLTARNLRPRPHLDDKILTGWNGLMIDALSRAATAFHEPRYLHAAQRAATFVLDHMRTGGRLLRSFRNGAAHIPAYLDDYAYFAAGLLSLHKAGGEARWLGETLAMTDQMIELFHDEAAGGFFSSSGDHAPLLVAGKEMGGGGNMPAGNGVAASTLIELSRLTRQPRYHHLARRTLHHFASTMHANPHGHETLVLASSEYLHGHSGERASSGPVTWQVDDEPRHIRAGGRITITLHAIIDEPYHIQGPGADRAGLLPTTLTRVDGPVSIVAAKFPAASSTIQTPTGPLGVHGGAFTVELTIEAAADAPAGPTLAAIQITAQPCDDQACLAPASVVVKIPLNVK